MAHFYESTLIDTVDGFQCKSYASEHPEGFVIVKPKYIPADVIQGEGLKYRYLFEKCLVRFNLFAQKERLKNYLDQYKQKFPDYIYHSPIHKNWFFVVPKEKIKNVHDGKKGIKELMKIPRKDCDVYLVLVQELIIFLTKSGVSIDNLGITHSTLLGNYTPGTSDIDIIIYGKDNGWTILNYLKTATHEKLHWKTDDEWAEYYKIHKTSESLHFTEKEYVKHMSRKRYEGMFGGTVFTLFTSEEPEETWFKWGDETYEPKGVATVTGDVIDHYNSHVRPGFYGIEQGIVLEKDEGVAVDSNIPLKRVVTYSIPFVQQALKGEKLKACGLLELVTPLSGKKYYRVVVGYFDAYVGDRREREYIKVIG
jgi:predicted nucleotidyltransferase